MFFWTLKTTNIATIPASTEVGHCIFLRQHSNTEERAQAVAYDTSGDGYARSRQYV